MRILQTLCAPLSLAEFKGYMERKVLLARPGTAAELRGSFGWPRIERMLSTGHGDCWLAKDGSLPRMGPGSSGSLTMPEAIQGFTNGHTIFIRHAEQANETLSSIALEFHEYFRGPVDLQVYATPAGQEGFHWHYDLEEVFVIQSKGTKEFILRKNRMAVLPEKYFAPTSEDEVSAHFDGPEIRCTLNAGDFLYIPSGYWHKARALTDSFHLSIGVRPGLPRL